MQISQGIILILGVVFLHSASAKLKCKTSPVQIGADWMDLQKTCIQVMRNQVQTELEAAVTYMAMGAHFARDTVNRPGFSKMFFESASEEREHAIKIISYLLMRGELTEDIAKLIQNPAPIKKKSEWKDGVEALQDALKLEVIVTNKIRNIIEVCEGEAKDEDSFNDYQLVDYLTADFLEEQYTGQRDLAGKIQTLGKMMAGKEGAMGEFLFDKKLLSGAPL